MKSLLDDGKATSLSLRYGKAVANRVVVPSTIYDMNFRNLEDSLECDDLAIMEALQYYFPL